MKPHRVRIVPALVVLLAFAGMAHVAAVGPWDSPARDVTIPAGTVLQVRLENAVGSDFSRVEDPVRARLARPVVVEGHTVLPAGSTVVGSVVDARRSGRVKGRARLAVRFHHLAPAGRVQRYAIRTRTWVAVAPATKKKDALTIAVPAAGGAVIGGIAEGKKGAGIGALIGGGAGTGVVLATRGKEMRLRRGAVLALRLAAPLTVHVGATRAGGFPRSSLRSEPRAATNHPS